MRAMEGKTTSIVERDWRREESCWVQLSHISTTLWFTTLWWNSCTAAAVLMVKHHAVGSLGHSCRQCRLLIWSMLTSFVSSSYWC